MGEFLDAVLNSIVASGPIAVLMACVVYWLQKRLNLAVEGRENDRTAHKAELADLQTKLDEEKNERRLESVTFMREALTTHQALQRALEANTAQTENVAKLVQSWDSGEV